jgi:protein gp37
MEKTSIGWTEFTWNPWQGCHKVSDGCKYCYMFRDKEKYGQNPNIVVRSAKNTFNKPVFIEEPSLIFACSWSDFFIQEADEWRIEAWNIIASTPHTYQILTKRPERIKDHLPPNVLKNVWIGVSIENNKNADRAKYLSQLGGYTTFISFEPLLEPIEWIDEFDNVDWIIIGAESGNINGKYKFRECKNWWVSDLVAKAKTKGIAVFVKQIRLDNKLITNVKDFPGESQYQEYP